MGDLFWNRCWLASNALVAGSTVSVQDADFEGTDISVLLQEVNVRVQSQLGFHTSRKVYATRTDRGVYCLKLSR